MTSNKISLNPSSIVRTLGIVAVLLVLASAAGQLASFLTGYDSIYGLVPLFDLDAEGNIPTFFSTFLLLFATILLAVITILKRKQTDFHSLYWTVLSFGLLFMAVDEAGSIHEKLIRPTRMLLEDGNLGIFYFTWVIPMIALIFVLTLFFFKFFLHLPPKIRFTFLMAAALYIGGAIGLELIDGRYFETHGEDLIYNMMVTIEESMEMAGAIVFNWALLVYIADNYREVQIRFDAVREETKQLHEKLKTD